MEVVIDQKGEESVIKIKGRDSRFMKMYQRLLARGKSKQKALIAVARKLLVLIWNM